MEVQVLVTCALLAVVPCLTHVARASGQPQQRTGWQDLKDLETEFWDWRMQDAPVFASTVGDSTHNDMLESYQPDVYANRQSTVQNFFNRAQAIDSTHMNKSQKLDYDIFTDHLQTFLDGARWNDYFTVNPVNFLEGITYDPGRMATFMPFNTVGDFENYLQRLIKLPVQVDQQIDLLKIAVSVGHTLNNMSVAAVPDQIDSLVNETTRDTAFYQPTFTSVLDKSHIGMSKRRDLRARAETAINNIKQALLRLKTYLIQSYMPAARPTWGIWGWRDGRAIYEQCLKYHTSTNMTAQEIHELGLREVARIRASMDQALERLQFTGSIKQFYDSLRSDPRFHKNSSEALLDTYKDYIYNRVTPKLDALFKDIPTLPLKVEASESDGPLGIYLSGTPDGTVPGTFYANIMHPNDTVTISMMSLVLHEAVPGHHLQAIYSLTSSIPKYRAMYEDDHYYRMPATFPIYTAYIEGWALYAEYLGEELNLYTDDYMLMGRYSEEIFRACRLVVDTGLHYFGWERERAIQYMLNNTASSRTELTTEIDRYMTWPGQATAYKIGEIKIKSLRQKATKALGSRFQLKEFHHVLLQNGGMPLSLLERLVDQWIAEAQVRMDTDLVG